MQKITLESLICDSSVVDFEISDPYIDCESTIDFLSSTFELGSELATENTHTLADTVRSLCAMESTLDVDKVETSLIKKIIEWIKHLFRVIVSAFKQVISKIRGYLHGERVTDKVKKHDTVIRGFIDRKIDENDESFTDFVDSIHNGVQQISEIESNSTKISISMQKAEQMLRDYKEYVDMSDEEFDAEVAEITSEIQTTDSNAVMYHGNVMEDLNIAAAYIDACTKKATECEDTIRRSQKSLDEAERAITHVNIRSEKKVISKLIKAYRQEIANMSQNYQFYMRETIKLTSVVKKLTDDAIKDE